MFAKQKKEAHQEIHIARENPSKGYQPILLLLINA